MKRSDYDKNRSVIIAGGRDFDNYGFMKESLESVLGDHCENYTSWCPHWDFTVVSGKAKGADTLGEKWAKSQNFPVEDYPANWEKYGKRAGYVRNRKMAGVADILVAFWDGRSRGTASMINLAQEFRLETHIFYYEKLQ